MATNYNEKYKQYVILAENALNGAFGSFEEVPEPLISAMKYSVNAGGKRLRPVLAFAAADMYGNAAAAAPFAAALELIHTYSLIHDDLPCMDNDDYRRGLPTNHKVFGEGMAVLAGDALLNMAYEILFDYISEHPETNNIKAAKTVAFAAGGLGMAGGQSIDLCSSGNPLAGEKELLYIHAHKTGSLITASLLAGAYSANADEEHIEQLREIGDKLGILFQITDDLLDIEGDSAVLGKSTGKDEQQSKLTYPKVYGLQQSKQKARQTAQELLKLLDWFKLDVQFFIELTQKMLNRNK